jgi:hypothetical protein
MKLRESGIGFLTGFVQVAAQRLVFHDELLMQLKAAAFPLGLLPGGGQAILGARLGSSQQPRPRHRPRPAIQHQHQ